MLPQNEHTARMYIPSLLSLSLTTSTKVRKLENKNFLTLPDIHTKAFSKITLVFALYPAFGNTVFEKI